MLALIPHVAVTVITATHAPMYARCGDGYLAGLPRPRAQAQIIDHRIAGAERRGVGRVDAAGSVDQQEQFAGRRVADRAQADEPRRP